MSYLAQCLTHMPSQDMRKIAGRLFPGDLATWGRAASISTFIVEKLLDENFLAGFLKKLNERELNVISLLVWGGSGEGLPKNEVERLLRMAGDDKPAESLTSLAGKGIVFQSGYGAWGNFFLPEDLADKLAVVLARNLPPRAVSPGKDVSENIFTGSFYEDCLTFLAYVHKKEVSLTQKGAIHKRTLAKILNVLQFKESLADIPADFYYTLRFSLLLNYCNFIKAIFFQGQMVGVQTDSIVRWLREKPLNRISKATPFIWNFLFRACPNPKIAAVIKLILQMKDDQWYGYEELAGVARKLIAPFTCAGPDPENFLDILLDAGLLVEGPSRQGERLVRFGFWSPWNQTREFPGLPGEEDRFWVQPNFEVLAPPRLAPGLRWQLEMVADPVKVDQAFSYALNKEAALGFFDRGGHVQEMLDFLEKHSAGPLPQNVLFTIKEWGALYGRVSFWDVFLLRCDDFQLADEIAGHPKLKPYIQGRFDQNHLIVSRSQYESLLAALQKQGYFPRKGIVNGSTS